MKESRLLKHIGQYHTPIPNPGLAPCSTDRGYEWCFVRKSGRRPPPPHSESGNHGGRPRESSRIRNQHQYENAEACLPRQTTVDR
eukprot:1115684-Karenia_brevis.AAC.1